MSLPKTHKGIVMYPPGFDVRVETLPTPQIEHPDDAIVKVKVAGLCGSDLHQYRYHDKFLNPFIGGHEFSGDVVALGSNFGASSADMIGRPLLYATLKVGDKVVAPFTSTCCECHFCRLGFTSRCESSTLFGSQLLPGGQAQYVRVPKAGGTLFKIPPDQATSPHEISQWNSICDYSLLLLADILPTGVFAVTQALQHPNILPILNSKPFPVSSSAEDSSSTVLLTDGLPPLTEQDKQLTLAVIGLGPVGLCAVVSLLDQLANKGCHGVRIVAIDLTESRRIKAAKIVDTIGGVAENGVFKVATPDEGKKIISEWTGNLGCNAVLEIVGHTDALTLAYDLIRPFGVITSVGVHQNEPIAILGKSLYNKNVSLTFGRCPVRAMFPFALQLLLKRQDIFASIGQETSLIDKVVAMDDVNAKEYYAKFERGLCGKVIFEPWK